MIKKKQKESWREFLTEFTPKIAHLRDFDSWKDDFLANYGYVWTRWYQGVPGSEILKDLTAHLLDKENRNRHGTIVVKLEEDRIKLCLKGDPYKKAWQKVILGRFWDRDNVVITKGLNITLELTLTDEEKRIIKDEDITTKRILTSGRSEKSDSKAAGDDD
jgi:hypothetical protein